MGHNDDDDVSDDDADVGDEYEGYDDEVVIIVIVLVLVIVLVIIGIMISTVLMLHDPILMLTHPYPLRTGFVTRGDDGDEDDDEGAMMMTMTMMTTTMMAITTTMMKRMMMMVGRGGRQPASPQLPHRHHDPHLSSSHVLPAPPPHKPAHSSLSLASASCLCSQRRPPEVLTPSLGPAVHPERFLDGPGARRGPAEAETGQGPRRDFSPHPLPALQGGPARARRVFEYHTIHQITYQLCLHNDILENVRKLNLHIIYQFARTQFTQPIPNF